MRADIDEGGSSRPITIVYRRLPSDIREFPGILLEATSNRLVVESPIKPTRPLKVFGRVIADEGYLAIWFIYRNRWYDIGKFYDRSKKRIGYYCDIVKPVRKLLDGASRTTVLTDLFLDLWIAADGQHVILDEDELERALSRHEISKSLAGRARKEIAALLQRVDTDRFPLISVRKVRLSETDTGG